jgi:hypothetical protein
MINQGQLEAIKQQYTPIFTENWWMVQFNGEFMQMQSGKYSWETAKDAKRAATMCIRNKMYKRFGDPDYYMSYFNKDTKQNEEVKFSSTTKIGTIIDYLISIGTLSIIQITKTNKEQLNGKAS